MAHFDSFTDDQVEEALAAAAAAFETWRRLPVDERARIVRRAVQRCTCEINGVSQPRGARRQR